MIVVDIETSGLLMPDKIGIWQIGAVEFENPENVFLEEARIDDSDIIENEALIVTGKTEAELRDATKQSQKELLEHFFEWASQIENATFVAHNTPFDYGFIYQRAKRYGLFSPFSHRTFDLHVFAAMKYFNLHGKFAFEEGKSTLNLPKIIEFCGMQDERIALNKGEVVKEGKPHNALEDAKLESECLSRILYGHGMFDEYSHFEVPYYLQQ